MLRYGIQLEASVYTDYIPGKNGAACERAELMLRDWACGIAAVVTRVSDRDPSALREMERLGLRPGIVLIVKQVFGVPRYFYALRERVKRYESISC